MASTRTPQTDARELVYRAHEFTPCAQVDGRHVGLAIPIMGITPSMEPVALTISTCLRTDGLLFPSGPLKSKHTEKSLSCFGREHDVNAQKIPESEVVSTLKSFIPSQLLDSGNLARFPLGR
uniref:IclR-ED domain-containing protein n=1 Tax=Mesocestoides corti TaxID=53468 RepID=A0A5K3ETQ9_MESCO